MAAAAQPRVGAGLLFVGAHPDDAEFHAGGLMVRYAAAGRDVSVLSLTDGSAGHQSTPRAQLAARRAREAADAAETIGAHLEIWDVSDGELTASLENRHRLIAAIRGASPRLIVTHRAADYHPDHRAAGLLVQDAAYLLQVPNVVPQVDPMPGMPVIACAWDAFTRPAPLHADVVASIDGEFDRVVDMLHRHPSQVYEWLPHTLGVTPPAASDPGARRRWLTRFCGARARQIAAQHQDRSGQARYAEAFEISEYGRQPDPTELPELFCLPE